MRANLLPEEPIADEPSDVDLGDLKTDRDDQPHEDNDFDSDPDDSDIPCTDDGADDDSRWDVFIPDDDQRDPEPEPGDFWIENALAEFPFVSGLCS